MTSRPKMFVDQCPVCKLTFDEATLPKLQAKVTPGHCSVVVCNVCNHLIAVGVSDDGNHVEASTVPYEWFHEWFPEEDRRLLHDYQEQEFHERGEWG